MGVIQREVYFIHDAASQAVKIGYSSDVPSRKSGLQTGNPNPLVILGSLPGGRTDEQRFHELFGDYRKLGEWFRGTEEALATMRELLVLNGSPRTVQEELERRNNCRYGLRGVEVCRAGAGLERWVILHSSWGAADSLLLTVYLKGFDRSWTSVFSAEDCYLMAEWPVTCRCWVEAEFV